MELEIKQDRTQSPDCQEGWTETHLGMSNYDHHIDDGFEAALKSGFVYGRHAAWNFNGLVWWDGENFREEVWVYHVAREILIAPTLQELMDLASSQYGEA